MRDDVLTRLREEPIDWRYKGFPPAPTPVTAATLAERGWSLLAGDLLLPVAVLKETALAHNIALMARFCREHSVSLAPHAKTTMAPELVKRQLDAGAWGITAATMSQVRVYRAFGIPRIVLANELVEGSALRWLADELSGDAQFDFYCLVDSTESVETMESALSDGGTADRPVQVLLELGIPSGRTGCRSLEEALQVAEAVERSHLLELAGVEGFEGIIHGADLEDVLSEVDAFLDHVGTLLLELEKAGRLDHREEVVLTVGGSAFFDRVVERLPPPLERPTRLVLRSGCYLTHDSGLYERLSPLAERGEDERLRHALEVWGVVLSRPEPDLAITGFGKRDVSYDIGLPAPLLVHGPSGTRDVEGAMTVFELNDQHAFLRIPRDDQLAPGDLVGCGVSHPCTTFDKWRLIPVVDDGYRVIDAVRTFF